VKIGAYTSEQEYCHQNWQEKNGVLYMHQHSWVVPAAMPVCGLQIIGTVYVVGHHGRKGCAVGVLLQETAVVVMCRAWYRTLKRHQDLHPHQHHLDCSLLCGRGAVMVHLSPSKGQATPKSQSLRAVGQDSWRRGTVWSDLMARYFLLLLHSR